MANLLNRMFIAQIRFYRMFSENGKLEESKVTEVKAHWEVWLLECRA
jgi:hypothetical protein